MKKKLKSQKSSAPKIEKQKKSFKKIYGKPFVKDEYGRKYEIVDKVPKGFSVWNIPVSQNDEYLPLSELKNNQPFAGAREVNTKTLKVVKVKKGDANTIITATTKTGAGTLDKMSRFLTNKKTTERTYGYKDIVQALPKIKKISWEK